MAATHRNLEADVEAGRFRQDLFYRVNTHLLTVPPLRQRLSDVGDLSEHLLGQICKRWGLPTRSLADDVLSILANCAWEKNNVRELRNVLERMLISAESAEIGVRDIPREIGRSHPLGTSTGDGHPDEAERNQTFKELKSAAERRILEAALERNGWHISQTAKELGLADHSSLLKIMRRHQLRRP